jgi:hypothetical protein
MLISLCLVLKPTSAFSRLKTESPRLDRASALLSFECNFAEGQRRKLIIDGSTKSVVAPVRVNILRVEQHRHEEADDHFWGRIFGSNIRSFSPRGHLMWVSPSSDHEPRIDHEGLFEASLRLDTDSFALIWNRLTYQQLPSEITMEVSGVALKSRPFSNAVIWVYTEGEYIAIKDIEFLYRHSTHLHLRAAGAVS